MTQQQLTLKILISEHSANGYLIQDAGNGSVTAGKTAMWCELAADDDLCVEMHTIEPITVETPYGEMTACYASDVRDGFYGYYYRVLF
jgi:hypothetical protein